MILDGLLRNQKKCCLQLVKVPEGRIDEMLDEFYDKSMFTFEGLDISEGTEQILDFLLEHDYEKKENYCWYWFNGDMMNKKYGLTGDNAYQDNLTFLVIPDYYNPMVKIQCGARWFDDIVDNNAIRQKEIDNAK